MASDPPRSEASVGRRLVVWQVIETAGFESAWVQLDELRLRAVGRVAGQLPEPYWLSYVLETDANAVTTRLDVTCMVVGVEHRLHLHRNEGGWTVDGEARPDLAEALDCDLACSPVTNTMPIVRHGLHRGPGQEQFLMAFVEVPTLRVSPARQAYTHLGLVDGGGRVRYTSREFSSELQVDNDGLVIDYPTMARRIRSETDITSRERVGGPGSVRPSAR